jgi:glycerol-3-phosphate dehydrogenase
VNRDSSLQKILGPETFDLAIIGGGATGMGIALDAASRNFSVALLEQADFGKGTSSRSTKLIHGGVRYLQQGNIPLVIEALRERGLLRHNASHLVHDLPFIVPNYAWWETPFYGIGMRVYDMLAGKYNFHKSKLLSKTQVLQHIPTLEQNGLRGGVLYYDAQFDDARLLIDLAHTATSLGATLLNYAKVTALTKDPEGFLTGVDFTDFETAQPNTLRAKCIINATGPFSDSIRKLDDPAARAMIAPSQGIHLVLHRSFLPGDAAIMVPHTSDGRVMFAIPFLNHTLLGTTDTPIQIPTLEPAPQPKEIDFLLTTAARYLTRPPARSDILSVFSGIRPLFKSSAASTAELSRDHSILISNSGLLTIAGGKWTTYRKMAQDAVNHAIPIANLEDRPCLTHTLPIENPSAAAIASLQSGDSALARQLHPDLPYTPAHLLYAIRHEMARTLDDLLSRRTRTLILNAKTALAIAPQAATLLATELHHDQSWAERQLAEFRSLARNYLVDPNDVTT